MAEKEEQVVKRWLETVSGGFSDYWPGIEANWHEDAVWHLIGNTPRSGVFHGLESIKRDFMGPGQNGDGRPGPSVQGLSSEYGVTLTVDDVVSTTDNRVIVFARTDGSGRNGVPYQNEYCWVFTVRGDKIARLDEYCDTVAIEEAHFDKKLVPRGTTEPVYAR